MLTGYVADVSAADLASEARMAAHLCGQARSASEAKDYAAMATSAAANLADIDGYSAEKREATEAVLACRAALAAWRTRRPATMPSLFDDDDECGPRVAKGGQIVMGL